MASPSAFDILDAADRSSAVVAAQPEMVAAPDTSQEFVSQLTKACRDAEVTAEDLVSGTKKATAVLFEVKALFHMGKTIDEVKARFADIFRTLVMNEGSRPQGLLSEAELMELVSV